MNLEVQDLTKSFESHQILKELTFSITDAQAIGIIGPSGSGKSTLLRILAGLENPTSGEIRLDGEKMVFEEKNLRQHRLHMSIVFQAFNLFPHLNALENICLPLIKVHGQTKEEAENTAMSLLQKFDMAKHALKRPSALSGGQSQRVAIIRAIATKPKILFLDEPTSALDPYMTVEVLDQILELRQEMGKLILITHHLQFARQATDWILFLEEGRVCEIAPTALFFEHPSSPNVQKYLNTVLKY